MSTNTNIPVQAIETRDMIFGDLPLDHWAAIGSDDIPWTLFKEAKQSIDKGNNADAIKTLKKITGIDSLESRHYLQAWHFLNQLEGSSKEPIKLFGVVVEVAIEQGFDLLAVYADHSARYYNYSGSAIIWEHPDNSIDNKIDEILIQGMDIVKKIGPWKGERPAAPTGQMARISLLTSHGLHFGQADQQVLFTDPMASKTMYAMLDVMETLMSKTTHK